MPRIQFLSCAAKIGAFTALLLSAHSASALQPLEEFVASANSANFDAREQSAVVDQRGWERSAALGRLLPSVSALGIYQRNQYEVQATLPGTTEAIILSPQNQVDAIFQLDVPLIDVANYHRYRQAKHVERAASAQGGQVTAQVDAAVARAYYQLVGSSALAQAAERSVALAQENYRFVETRNRLGNATQLDVQRARANLERARQDLADARLGRDLAARDLETLSGLTPTAVDSFSEVSLEHEAPLKEWLQGEPTPADLVQKELTKAAASGHAAAKAALLPTLSANAQERLTNATGFAGRWNIYTLQLVLSWRLDWTTYANSRAAGAAENLQKVREERVHRITQDAIFGAYQRVETGIAKSTAARAQADAAHKAAALAVAQYRAGNATQLEVTQAQRDAFVADVTRVQADADLSFGRAQLRALTGQALGAGSAEATRSPARSR